MKFDSLILNLWHANNICMYNIYMQGVPINMKVDLIIFDGHPMWHIYIICIYMDICWGYHIHLCCAACTLFTALHIPEVPGRDRGTQYSVTMEIQILPFFNPIFTAVSFFKLETLYRQ